MKKYATIYTQCVNGGEKMETKDKIKELRKITGMNRKEFCKYFEIPYRTVTEWNEEPERCRIMYYVCWRIK